MNYSDVSLMIDGGWTGGAKGRTIPIVNPATEEVIGQVAHAEIADHYIRRAHHDHTTMCGRITHARCG